MMLTSTRVRLSALVAAASMALCVAAAPASAQPQTGLVNVDISDNTIQVPIAVAANVCNVQVAVLSTLIGQNGGECDADADGTADAVVTPGGGGGPQTGLVNISVTDNVIQVPIGLAANICNVQAAVLASGVGQDGASCTAVSDSFAGGPRR